jgi:CelD/BcsL family acetyltransferase involved in cellulose biosynthesis
MHIEVVRTDSELEALKQDWNELLKNSASRVPFLRHEYLSTWWWGKGGGEWPESELYVVTGWEQGGILKGIAPLFLSRNLVGEPALLFLGSIEISDYLDLICEPVDLPSFVGALCNHLTGRDAPAWQVVDLYNLPERSPTLPALRSAAESRGWQYREEVLHPCPYIPLVDDWESYLAGIDKKQRHEIRRKMRRAEQHNLEVRWYIVESIERLDEEIELFLRLMAYDPVKSHFLSEPMRQQMKAIIRSAYQAGWLQLAFIEVDGEKGAAYLNFDFDNRLWVYNSGFNPEMRELSLGWVLLGHLIKRAIEQGRESFDFMRGNEDYKYRFGAIDRQIVRAAIRC